MNQIFSYEVAEQYENTLTVYVNNVLIAYVTGKRLNSIRSVRQVKYLNQLHNKEKNNIFKYNQPIMKGLT